MPSSSPLAPSGSKPDTSFGTSRPSCARSESMPTRIGLGRSFSAAVTSLAPVRGPARRSRRRPPQHRVHAGLDQELLHVARVDSTRPWAGGDLVDRGAQQPRADDPRQFVHRHGQRGDQRRRHAAVADPVLGGHLPVRRLVDEAVRERLVVPPARLSSSDISVPTRDIISETIDRCMSSRVAPAGRENRNPVWSVPGRMTIRGSPGSAPPPLPDRPAGRSHAAQPDLGVRAVLLVDQAEQVEQRAARVELGRPSAAQALLERRRHQHQRVDLHPQLLFCSSYPMRCR